MEFGKFNTNKLSGEKKHLFFDIRKPQEGPLSREGTPEKDILEKHPELYSDMTIEGAIKKRMLCHSDKFFKAQKVSEWQKCEVVYKN